MSSGSEAMSEQPLAPDAVAPATLARTRPFYWSVRRELWEHRAIYVAPLAVAGVALFGVLLSMFGLPHAVRSAEAKAAAARTIDPQNVEAFAAASRAASHAADAFMGPYSFIALAVMLISLIVAIFYSLGALHGERRDRSILFWKSLPVSDLTTVLAKAVVPLAVQPVIVFATIVAAQLVTLVLSSLVVLANGIDPTQLWSRVHLGFFWLVMAYGLPYIALWHAPMYAWLLLVGGWAKRMTFVWAVAPPLALCLVERLAFGSTYLIRLLGERLLGGFGEIFSVGGKGEAPIQGLADLDPARSLSLPGLWGGLLFAVLFLALAVRLRRSRDPI
jgi:ABC-2 type transport system permease protein